MSKQNTNSQPQAVQKTSQQDKNKSSKSHVTTATTVSPPAFNPKYPKHDATSSSSSSQSSRASSRSSSVERGIPAAATTTASHPIELQTVDPLIASILQQGFPSNYNHHSEDFINNTSDHSASWLLQDKENGLDNIEYVIMDEPQEILSPTTTTTPKKTNRVSNFLYKPSHTGSANSKNCHQPPSSPPKIVQLTEQGNHYGKAQVLAWRTQRASKAALRKALQLPKKHISKPKQVALKSVEVVKEVSLRSVELARKHSPIMATRR